MHSDDKDSEIHSFRELGFDVNKGALAEACRIACVWSGSDGYVPCLKESWSNEIAHNVKSVFTRCPALFP